MAESTPTTTPALPSTTDTNPYIPVSWMAVASALVAGTFVLLLIFFGYSAAFKDKKPLVMPSLLVLAAGGLVLSFAGRRMIRNAEGTRTGERLTEAAWWVCIVGGLGYAAYLFGIEYTIKSDAQSEVERWAKEVISGDFDSAFYSTLDPASRAIGTRTDLGELKKRFNDRYVSFGQLDIVRIARRNPGACTFEPGGMREWMSRGDVIECVYTGVVKSPEGTFPVEIPLRGTEGTPGPDGSVRQWEIRTNPNGLVQIKNVALTAYGWRLVELQMEGGDVGRAFVNALRQGPAAAPWAFQTMVRADGNQDYWGVIGFMARGRFWGGLHDYLPVLNDAHRVPLLALEILPEYVAHRWDKFFRLPGGAAASEGKEQTFLAVWKRSGLLPSGKEKGGLIPNNEQIDAHDLVSITDTAIEIRVPCEMAAPASGGQYAFRARVVVACADPAVVAELKKLRDEADPNRTISQPADFRTRGAKWRVVAIESDLDPVSTAAPQQGPGGGR